MQSKYTAANVKERRAKPEGNGWESGSAIRRSLPVLGPAKRIHVMHVIPTLNCGGAERICVEIARGLSPERFAAVVLTLEPISDTRLVRDLHSANIRIDTLKKCRGPDLRMFQRFAGALKRYKPDILHTHMYVMPYVGLARWLKRIPSVHTVHNVAEKDATGLVRLSNSLAFRLGTIPIGISPRVRDSIDSLYHPRRVTLITNGIDLRSFRQAQEVRSDWRLRNGYAERDFVIASVGRLDPQKNFPILLAAFAELGHRHDELKLMIAGEGQCRKDLEKKIDELHIGDRVRLAGERSDIPEMLLACDLYVTTSLWEGNPLSVMEAMAAGLSVVASAVGGIPDLIDDGISGILLTPNDQKQLVHSVEKMIDCPEQRRRLGEAARTKAFRTMDVLGMVRAYEELYEQLLIV
jgi:glycosyltransferase involved in cell wall biosynthesis